MAARKCSADAPAGVDRVRLALLVLGGIVFIPWALSWGLYSL
ncbi:hypothetical protein [Nocardia brasiliensis]|nr:hypothetical protein [Nocardia brasiliensis]